MKFCFKCDTRMVANFEDVGGALVCPKCNPEKVLDKKTQFATNYSGRTKPCYKGCGAEIYFDETFKSDSGKFIPIDANTDEPHQCNGPVATTTEYIPDQVRKIAKKPEEKQKVVIAKEILYDVTEIIEKETGRADERHRIAGVFVNRLNKNMRLQSDPTILYGVHGGAVKWGKPILQSEKDAKNAHNTYQINGLPPTPICNPGRPALEAALNPTSHDDVFFVADGTGGHIFSKTYEDHTAAVSKWREIERDMRSRQAEAAEEAAPGEAEGAVPGKAENGSQDIPITQVLNASSGGAEGAEPAAPSESSIPMPVRKPKN